MGIAIQRWPQTDDELWEFVVTVFGIRIPRTKICPNHSTPFDAFADAYFARSPVSIWKASRGFGGKSHTLAALVLSEAVCLGAQSTLLGGSAAQSLRVHEVTTEVWDHPLAPKHVLDGDPTTFMTRFQNGAWIRALMASQKSARGPHPQRLRLDEIDEMDLAILEAAQGQPMDGRGILSQTVMSSTHQYPDKTMTEMINRGEENGWPIFEWCWRENLEPHGWLTKSMVERKQQEVSSAMWDIEYDLQEPSFEGRAISGDYVDWLFDKSKGSYEGYLDERIFAQPSDEKAQYITGVDWAKEKDWTIIVTYRIDTDPWELVAWTRTGRKPWPLMVQILDDQLAKYPGPCAHDSTGIGNVVKDLIRSTGITDVVFGGRNKDAIISEYVSAIEQRKLTGPFIDFAHGEHKYATLSDLYGKGHTPDTVIAGSLAWYLRNRYSELVSPVFSDFSRSVSPWSI